jgi:protein disulfide-isomerase A1
MARATLIFVFALISLSSAFAGEVVVLTSENFDEVVNNNDFVLVEFYAPWCGHCKSLEPEYESAAASLKKDGSEIVLAKVDATEERDLGSKFGVQGFPTLKFFRSGNPTDYDGPRKAAGIISWLNKKTGPPTKALSTVEEFESFKAGADVVAVGSFAADSAEFKAFEKAALASDSVQYGSILDNEAVAAAAELGKNAISVFQNFDDGRQDFSGDASDSTAIADFVSGNSLPLVIEFSDEKSQEIFGNEIKSHVLIFDDDTDEAAHAALVEEARKVARNHKGQALFVTIPKAQDRISGFFGITEAELPTVRLVTMGGQMRKYAMPAGEVNAASMSAFVQDFMDGKLKPTLKSEEPPASQPGPVTVVVGKTFDSVVLDPSKDVLVEFYAPWCGHCKSLAPVYDKVGERFAAVPSVVIAKMDATANEHEAVEVQGFPTLKLWRADDKENPVDFNGSRDEEGFVEFLTANAAIKFDLAAAEEETDKDEL